MKKITLMLCACAMAFAGLLVSCNNGAEDYINSTSVSYNYRYKVTGTISEKTASGAIANPQTTSDVYTFTKAQGQVSWTENVTSKGDVPTYSIYAGGQADEVFTDTDASVDKLYKTWMDTPNGDDSNNGNDRHWTGTLYKFEDGFYIDLDRNKDRYVKVTLDGDFGDDTFTFSYEYTWDNLTTPSETTVNTRTYSGNLKFEKVAD